MPPSLGYITFQSLEKNSISFTCLLGDGSPTVVGGYGGWEQKQRSRRTSVTSWVGVDSLQLSIPLMFDSFAEGNGTKIEQDIRALERMAGLDAGVDEPPLVQFDSAGVVPHDAHDAPQNLWVVASIDWGDADRNEYGNRVRQAGTVTMWQYVEDGTLVNESSAARRRAASKKVNPGANKKNSKEKKYVVKNGDTVLTIAKKQLGKQSRWKEIVKLNKGLRDPRKKLQPGTVLNMP